MIGIAILGFLIGHLWLFLGVAVAGYCALWLSLTFLNAYLNRETFAQRQTRLHREKDQTRRVLAEAQWREHAARSRAQWEADQEAERRTKYEAEVVAIKRRLESRLQALEQRMAVTAECRK